ncbi:TauD/TfdA dioxygenase family protein [Streptomyces sp. NPDC004126]|uniref:TauD/TfdA dioxygenase family protein n=1 Tax=Streptomyces sp. NPDC004126 TaxID=3390695 RepID=UPI003CFE4A4A
MSTHTHTDPIVRPLTKRVGAELSGVRLSGDLDEPVVKAIREALLKHKVVFFRGQQHLDDAVHHAFASRLGVPIPHPTIPSEGDAHAVFEIDSRGSRATSWHSDVTFVRNYPAFSILRGIVIPPCGGDTAWANTVTAYDDLPVPLRRLADSLWAVHTNAFDYAAAARSRQSTSAEREFRGVFESVHFETEHPVVRVHPETQERSLVVGGFAQRILGLSQHDSQQIQQIFQRYITRPENTVRWRWSEGDVAIWDNRATQHVAVDDYGDAPRTLHRICVEGEAPVSVFGEQSVARDGGDAAWYQRA